jgi:hypothetical protein
VEERALGSLARTVAGVITVRILPASDMAGDDGIPAAAMGTGMESPA